jgi:cytochrome c oxidase assembly protein subunit 15
MALAPRLAFATALAAVPLVLFGGSVTTLGAGMAVDGWLIAEGRFLLFFPVDAWFRNLETFVEHTHRLFGVLVGVLALGTVLATVAGDARTAARGAALLGLGAIVLQGVLGGFRVLEASPALAFLHGALAQTVFALLVGVAVVLSPAWRDAPASRVESRAARSIRSALWFALVATFAQVVLGAWYRHALRPVEIPEAGMRFLLHAFGALLALVALLRLAAALAGLEAPARAEPAGRALLAAKRWITRILVAQLLLGFLAWIGRSSAPGEASGAPVAIGPLEWSVSVLHVLGGGLLLSLCAYVLLWSKRLAPAHDAAQAIAGAHSRGAR